VYRQNDLDEVLCYGTSLGYSVFWGKVPNDRGPDTYYEMCAQRCSENEIMCITGKSFGTGDTRVIIGTRDSVVQVWKISGTAIENVFSVKIPRTVPSAAAFVEHSQDVLVFGREDGALCVHII
jgi:hypothetical protein